MLVNSVTSAGSGLTPITMMGTRRATPLTVTDANVAATDTGSCESL